MQTYLRFAGDTQVGASLVDAREGQGCVVEELKALLVRQLTSPVEWLGCMHCVKDFGSPLAIEVRPLCAGAIHTKYKGSRAHT